MGVSGVVLALLATAQALQVGHSGYTYIGVIGGVIGGLIGAGITLSVTRAAANIGAVRKRGKARYNLALVGLVGLMAINPCLIFPGAYQTFDIHTPWMLVMAAIAWAVAPDLSMVLAGAITGTGMFAQEQQEPPQSKPQAEPVRGKAKASKVACPHCKKMFSQSGLNAHVAYCEKNPARRSKFSVLISERIENGRKN
jgi:hypothetical protein